MKRYVYIAIGILVATALLGFWMMSAGVTADAEAPGPADEIRALGLPPVLWPLLFPVAGALLMGLIIITKLRAVRALWNESNVGKAGMFTAISILFAPALTFLMQSFVGLKYFGLIDTNGMMTVIALLQCGLLLAFGNYVATAKRGVGGGFNTPWTKNSEIVWRKTQRFLGRGVMVLTLFVLLTLFFAPPLPVIFAHVAAMVVMKVIAAAYSYLLWRREAGVFTKQHGESS